MDRFFCIVDKSFGEAHSFVDGMLLGALHRRADVIVAYAKGKGDTWKKNKNVLVAPYNRKGLGRILYPLWCLFQFFRRHQHGRNMVFVRNEVIALLLFALCKALLRRNYSICFQSSFPHVEYNAPRMLRGLINSSLSWSLSYCSKIFVVSELAAKRVSKYAASCPTYVIPLCCDFEEGSRHTKIAGPLRFVYAGSFDRLRDLDLILRVFAALGKTHDFRLVMYGGDRNDLLRAYPEAADCIKDLLDTGRLEVLGRIPRQSLPEALSRCDIGLNLIPPKSIYLESSSTKLGEYLSQGLSVISSRGISYHEEMHSKGDIGRLANFETADIYAQLKFLIEAGRSQVDMREPICRSVCRTFLRYDRYVKCVAQD